MPRQVPIRYSQQVLNTPAYKHDCESCQYMCTVQQTRVKDTYENGIMKIVTETRHLDIYVSHCDGNASGLVVRHSSHGPDYSCWDITDIVHRMLLSEQIMDPWTDTLLPVIITNNTVFQMKVGLEELPAN